jgi:hypothetical protein
MYKRGAHDPVEYLKRQRRMYEAWQAKGNGAGHYLQQCIVCSEPFMSSHRDARFCDRRCYEWWRRRPPKNCVWCGKEFRRQGHARAKYCGNSCKTRACEWRTSQPGYVPQSRTKKSSSSPRYPGRILDIIRF